MRLQEQRLWDRMHANVSPRAANLQRVENMVGDGFPDVLALAAGVVNPIELKAVKELPKLLATRLLGPKDGLSADQRNWHLNWNKHGGQSLILLGTGEGARCKHYVVNGTWADEVNEWPLGLWVRHNLVPRQGREFWLGFTNMLSRAA